LETKARNIRFDIALEGLDAGTHACSREEAYRLLGSAAFGEDAGRNAQLGREE
jgi:hypothetical protein